MMAYAPARTIDNQVERLRKAGVPEDKIAEFVDFAEKNPGKNRKVFRQYLKGDYSEDTTTTEDATAAPAEPVPVMNWKDTSPGKYGGVEYRLGDDEKIRYTSPDSGREIVVEPGTKAYEAIMKIRPEPQVPEQALTPDQIRERALDAQTIARAGKTIEEQFPDKEGPDLTTGREPHPDPDIQRGREIQSGDAGPKPPAPPPPIDEPVDYSRTAQTEVTETAITGDDPLAQMSSKAEKLYGEDPLAGGPAQRNQQRVKGLYEQKQKGGLFGGPLYQKGSYLYEYDKDRGMWTVYTSQLGYATRQPMMQNGKPIQFSMPEAMNSNNSNVRELYDLAIVEGMVPG